MQMKRAQEITASMKALFETTAQALKGSARRKFMARTVDELNAMGVAGQEWARQELGWSPLTIKKGRHELETGIECVDGFNARGRKRTEVWLPNLQSDIERIADGQSQTDGSFKTTRLFTRLTAAEMRRQLVEQCGYDEAELPCEEVIRQRMNALGYRLRAVGKNKPQKRSPTPMRSSSRSKG
jgi:Rhodopirellula transposase DDE domain